MKKLLVTLLSGFITLAATAQTLTIKFNGNNRNRNYQVIIDGVSYYSNTNNTNNTNTKTANNSTITLPNQTLGSHSISVQRLRNTNGNSNAGNNTNNAEDYSNTFQLRQGYDMTIAVNGNGQVSFSEKRVRSRGNPGNYNQPNIPPMDDASFNQLLQTIRGKWTQSSKVTAARDAFANTSYYFTTAQVRQILLLINTEPNRLSLAKAAYLRVTDASNFTTLYDVFSSIASRDDMNTFIRSNPNNNGNYNGGSSGNVYKTPMADYQFSQLLQNVNNQNNQSGRVTAIRTALNNNANYFNTAQIRQLLNVVTTESNRLSLAKQSYTRVSDANNFSMLYDLIYSQAGKNELHNYVLQNGGLSNYDTTPYSKIPMADAEFSTLLQKATNHLFPWDKLRDLREAFNNTSFNFSTSQIRQLLTVTSNEPDRLDLAKIAWSRVTDPASFTQLFDLFTNQANRNNLSTYIEAHPL